MRSSLIYDGFTLFAIISAYFEAHHSYVQAVLLKYNDDLLRVVQVSEYQQFYGL